MLTPKFRGKAEVRRLWTFPPVCWDTQLLTSFTSLAAPCRPLGRTPYCCSTSAKNSCFRRSPERNNNNYKTFKWKEAWLRVNLWCLYPVAKTPPWTHVGPGRCVPRCSGLCRAPWRQSAGPSGCCGAAGPAGCGTSEPGTAASEHAQTLLRDLKT